VDLPDLSGLDVSAQLLCQVILYREARSNSWLDQDEDQFNFAAFLLRTSETYLSVDIAGLCTLDEAKGRFNPTHGIATLHVGRVRDLGLTVFPDPLPDNLAHAKILGLPPPSTDLKSAQDFANALADQSRLVWRRQPPRR